MIILGWHLIDACGRKNCLELTMGRCQCEDDVGGMTWSTERKDQCNPSHTISLREGRREHDHKSRTLIQVSKLQHTPKCS